MDSFYDVPRRAPVPTQIDNFLAGPTVPEVSMMCPPRPHLNNLPYSSWKKPINENIASVGRNNSDSLVSNQNVSQLLKKQVRFESPVQKPTHMVHGNPNPKCAEFQNVESPNLFVIQANQRLNYQLQTSEKPGNGAIADNNAFKRMYMANIPHRELDLSIIDLPRREIQDRQPPTVAQTYVTEMTDEGQTSHALDQDKENILAGTKVLPKSYREFLEIQNKHSDKLNTVPHEKDKVSKKIASIADDSLTDIFNYQKKKLDVVYMSANNRPQSPYRRISTVTDNSISANNRPKSPVVLHKQMGIVCNKRMSENDRYNSPVPPNKQVGIVYNNDNYRLHNGSESPPKYRHLTKSTCNAGNDHILEQAPVMPLKCDGVAQTTCLSVEHNDTVVNKEEKEPTNKDLLKIIAQQNEQLLILQKQVAMLLKCDQNQQVRPIEAPPPRHGEKLVSSTQNEYYRPDGTPKKRGVSKFSIDLMTSFEVAIRPQANKQNFINMEPKIQEITESESSSTSRAIEEKGEKDVEPSLHFQEQVRESYPSPEPSVNINMEDYDSSDEEATVSDIGATFYRNLMGQVNHILKKAHLHTQEEFATKDQVHYDRGFDKKDRTMSRVKEAMVKHLKSIGITVDNMDSTEGSVSSGSETPTEISFAVKQLLMKYLPDDQLAKVAQRQPPAPLFVNKHPAMVAGRPEFSFASVQYMKKYNLLPSNDVKPPRQENQRITHGQADNQKILDMTALNMQPKLL